MIYDIAALQYMYGANYSTNSGDTVYKWNPTTGQETINGVAQAAPGGNTVFMTIWDGGGNDTYDFSNYTTNLSVNLQPGGWTTVSATRSWPISAPAIPRSAISPTPISTITIRLRWSRMPSAAPATTPSPAISPTTSSPAGQATTPSMA